ncbi:putative antitoxin VapB38 [Gammaproteobacteria bacterium]
MNTTLDIDQDVMETAQAIAARHSKSIDAVISESARRGMRMPWPESGEQSLYRHGFRILPPRGEVITPEHVRRLMDEEGI